MSSVYMQSLNMYDMNMETLAEFMLMHDAANNQHWVKVIPFYGAFRIYENDAANPVIGALMPGATMLQESFLSFIGNAANDGSKRPYPYTIANPEIQLVLTVGLSIEKVAKLTGWDQDMITNFFKDYVVFG